MVLLEENMSNAYLRIQELISLRQDVLTFLYSIDFIAHCRMILEHTNSPASFRQRFFRYFNAFMMIRYMHFMRDHQFPDVPVEMASRELAKEFSLTRRPEEDAEQLLYLFRKLDKGIS